NVCRKNRNRHITAAPVNRRPNSARCRMKNGLKIRTLLPPGNRTRIRGCGTRRETICATRKTVTRARGEPPEGNYRSIHHQTFHLEVAEAVHSGSFLEFGEDLIDRFQSL